MIRLLAFAVAFATPAAALAHTPIKGPTEAQHVAIKLREASTPAPVAVAPTRIAPPRQAAAPRSIKIPRHIDWTLASEPVEMELRPARDFNALEDGFRIQGRKIGFFRSF